MHIELAPKYKPILTTLINESRLDASLGDSFNASGETIILVATKDEMKKILLIKEEELPSSSELDEGLPPVTLEGLKAIIKEQLEDRN